MPPESMGLSPLGELILEALQAYAGLLRSLRTSCERHLAVTGDRSMEEFLADVEWKDLSRQFRVADTASGCAAPAGGTG